MPACYWELCHCPDATPCNEHQGWSCGIWNGRLVRSPADINDAVTRDAELAIIRLDDDSRQRDAMRATLEARGDELKREADEIRQLMRSADSAGERNVVIGRVRDAYRRLDDVEVELRQAMADLDAMNAKVTSAGGLISTYLIVPYSSAGGYCACYDAKRARLAVIDGQTGVQRAYLAQVLAQRGAIAGQVLGLFSGLPSTNNLIQTIGTLGLVMAIAAYFVFGMLTAYFTLLATLLMIAAMLALMIVDVIRIDNWIASIRRRMVKLDLAYYRIQAISTCQRVAPGASIRPIGLLGPENAWLEEAGVIEPLPEAR